MIRLLLDQGLPRSTVQRLADQGIDVCHVADIGFSRATDSDCIGCPCGRWRPRRPAVDGISPYSMKRSK